MDDALEETKDKLIKKKRNHILKRIKKHLGIVRRESNTCSSQNNLPPLQFHAVHGDNIRISRDGTLARRFESFCRALTFSARPVRVNERIYLRFSEISNNWNGGIRFGFTSNDPATLENNLPKYACPDLTNRPGFWAKALHEQYCALNNVLYYYVNTAGDVIYGVNNEEKGIILAGIDVRGLLWTIIDIYGNCTAVELLDVRLLNQSSSSTENFNQTSLSSRSVNCITTPLQSLSIIDHENHLPPLQFHNSSQLRPIGFHPTKGGNIRLSCDNLIATRAEDDFCQGYVFSPRPIQTDEKLVIQILKTDHSYVGALALGLTSCDPASLNQYDLPSDSNLLLDRPEYWVVSKDIGIPCNKGDEISFCISSAGEVTISRNCQTSVIMMHVDNRLQLWVLLDVYGSTQSIRIFREPPPHPETPTLLPTFVSINSTYRLKPDQRTVDSANAIKYYTPSPAIHPLMSSASTSSVNVKNVMNSNPGLASKSISNSSQMMSSSGSDLIQIQPYGAVLVVNLPPAVTPKNELEMEGTSTHTNALYPSGHTASTCRTPCNQEYNQLRNSNRHITAQTSTTEKSIQKEMSGSECTICYEKVIDSVLYICGHMCMCYECAIKQWRGAGGGQCPLCRAAIKDVIRTYTT